MQLIAFILFLAALLATGVLGTETRLLFFWPGCALLGLAGLIAGLRWRLKVVFQPGDWCLLSVLALTIYLTTRACLTPVIGLAREDLFIVLGCFTAYVLVATAACDPRWRMTILGVLITLAAGNLLVGFIHFSGNWSFHVAPRFARSFEAGRIGGFFNHPNHLAAFFSHVFFLCLGVICFGRGGATRKLLLGFLCIALAIGMSLTVSRGALLGLAGGGLLFAAVSLWIVWKTQRHLMARLLVAVAVLVALGGGVLYKVNEEHLRRRLSSLEATTDVRGHIWGMALAQHQASPQPLVGDGARSFFDACFKHRPAEMPGWSPDALFAHNEYLQMLADYGWLGLLLAALVAIAHFSNGLRFLRWFAHWKFTMTGFSPSNSAALVIGCLAALTATMIHAVFEFHWHVPATAVTGALVLGVLANPGFTGPEHQPVRLPGARLGVKLALIAASVTMLAGALVVGRADYFAAKAELAANDGDGYHEIQFLTHAVEIDPHNADTWYRLGLAWLGQVNGGKSPAAIRKAVSNARVNLEQAVTRNPGTYLYPLALADALDALDQPAQARRMIERSLSLAPNHEEPRLALAIHHNRQRDWAAAERAYLWASRARAANLNGAFRWSDGYFAMLRQAAEVAGPPAVAGGAQPR